MKTVIYAGLLALIAFAAPGCMAVTVSAQAEGSFERTLNVSGPVSLDVSTGSGNTLILTGAGGRVQVHGRIRAGSNWFGSSRDAEEAVRQLEAHPPIEQTGQTIRIGQIANRDWSRSVSISYEIMAPAQSNVTSRTGSGSQTLEGLGGRLAVGTGSGRITLRDIKGDLEAHTGSGSIDATGFRGGLRLRTGSGGVRVQGEQSGRWDLETGSGPIDIDLPSDASFELSAHTGSGGVEVGYPMKMHGRIDRNRHDVSGTVGTGGQALNAHTGSGHIRIQ